MGKIIDHEEAFQVACYQKKHSNLARCYLDIHALLHIVWYCMNDDDPPDFPMRAIEEILGIDESAI